MILAQLSIPLLKLEISLSIKWECFNVLFPTLTQQIVLKVNVYNDFTQYMLVGNWVNVKNLLLYKKDSIIPICLNYNRKN